jgi:hypothetical protein
LQKDQHFGQKKYCGSSATRDVQEKQQRVDELNQSDSFRREQDEIIFLLLQSIISESFRKDETEAMNRSLTIFKYGQLGVFRIGQV